ncbi:MAG: SAF domain-containing protein [Candidatus Dormibacteria bacterium]
MVAQRGDERVVVAARTIAAGTVLQASTQDLSSVGALVHLGSAGREDVIPQARYRVVEGAVALVTIPKGDLILRHDLAFGSGSALRQLTLNLAFVPPSLTAGQRVDLFAVSGPQTGTVGPGVSLCGQVSDVACVVPLAQDVDVLEVDAGSHAISIAVTPHHVAPWLLLDATQAIWAVPAGALACEGAEQAISDPYQALQAIAGGSGPQCGGPLAPATRRR